MTLPLFDGMWRLMSDDGMGTRKYIGAIDENTLVVKTETYLPSMLAEQNAEDLKASDGKRWGDGQVFARVPMHIKYGELLEPTRQGDKRWLKRFWNNSDNAWMRTFRGTV
jgi:hypothetical protein